MNEPEGEALSEERRKEIFLALVDVQDRDVSVAQSRKLIAERFAITGGQLFGIEREGMEKQWPPLDH
jgi:hypothetical protein